MSVFNNIKGNFKYSKCFAETHPDLAKEWDYAVNGSVTPKNITAGSHYVAHWICSKNPEHKWTAEVRSRAVGGYNNCQECICLSSTHHDLAKEWDYSKNGTTTPKKVTFGSHYMAHWICSKNQEHKWDATVNDRTRGYGCPECCGKKANKDTCLLTTHSALSKEWDYNKNIGISPESVSAGSNRKAYWICSKNQEHKWPAAIKNRAISGHGCPICDKVVLKDGQEFDSLVEAYYALFLMRSGIKFKCNKNYPGINKRYDFYIEEQNNYVEVTSYHKNMKGYSQNKVKFWDKYNQKIELKRQYVENILKAKFTFVQKLLTKKETLYVRENCL